jgi:hypothetical protein
MRKFLSDVLINCDLTVSGSTSLGAATGVTVDSSDNSTKLATTAFVKAQGFVKTDTTYLLSVPANTTNITLQGTDSSTDEVTISAAGASSISRVSASELRITSTDTIDYISNVTFANDVITFTGVGNGFSGTINLSTYLTQAEGDARYLTSYSETDTLDTVTSRDGVTTNTIGVGTINVIGTTAGQELLTVDGTNGRLFTVTDDLSDSLFSVNTIAGLPVIEVFADNTIKLGNFANPIEIDSSANIVIPGTITASGYNDSNWNTAFNDRITAAAVSGTSTKTLTLTQGDGSTITASWTDIEGSGADGYVSDVALNGNSLDFTAVGSGFAGSIDLSGITSSFNAENVQTVYENIKNVSGGPIQKGTPLAVVPGQTSGNLSDVVPAAADDPTRMPAVFIANEDLANEAEGLGVVYGNITGIDTSAFDSGVTVYVAPGGGWTDTKPTGTNLIQNLGIITKVHHSNGGGVVMGAGRSNDVPNIANGYAWVGDGNGVATPTLLGTAAYESASTFALANHNHDDRYYTQTELDTEFNKYLRSDIPDSFNKLINSSLNITPEWGGGAINLKPSVAGGSTGIVFTSAQNINTDNGKDHGYLWWYDNNNNYSINPGSQENGAVVLGVMNDSVENGMGDSAVVESSGNIFLNPGIDPTEGSQGGNSGPNFTRGKVYVGRAAEFYEVYHEGNLNLGDYAAANHVHDYDNYVSWNLKTNGTQRTTVQSGGTLDIVAGSNVSVSYGAGGVVTISSTDTNTDTNNYVTGLSFNTGDGVLTATRQGLADLTVDLDGRYLTTVPDVLRQGTKLLDTAIEYYDEDSGGDLSWAVGADDRGGAGAAGQNAFVFRYNRGVRFGDSTWRGEGTEVLTLDDSGNVGILTPQAQITERLNVNGNIKSTGYLIIGGDDAARIALGSGTGNPVPQEIASFGSSVHIGAFVDFTIYNDTKEHMRSGTLQLVFNTERVMFNEVSTMDIGDTTPCLLTAVNNAGVISVLFETPDPTFHIKYQTRTI